MHADRTHLMIAALSMTPTDQLSAYTTSQLREAANDAEPRLLQQMVNDGPFMTGEEKEEWMDRVRALNIISAEVLRREARDVQIGPTLVAEIDGVRLANPLMCF